MILLHCGVQELKYYSNFHSAKIMVQISHLGISCLWQRGLKLVYKLIIVSVNQSYFPQSRVCKSADSRSTVGVQLVQTIGAQRK